MKLLIKELGYDIPEWRLTRYFEVNINDKDVFTVSGVDQRGSPYSLFKNVECPAASKTNRSSDQSYAFQLTKDVKDIKLRVELVGHYGEPPIDTEISIEEMRNGFMSQRYVCQYNPKDTKWEFVVPVFDD